MINIGTLIANLKLRDQLTPALAKAQQSLKNAGPKMKAVGRSMTTGLTLPILAAGAAAIKFAVDMNKSMANVATLIPGSTERVEELKKSVQDLAIETGKSTADLADGLYQVVSAFGDSADTAKILELNAKAAAAGLATTSDAIALTSAVTKGYGDTSFEAMQKASDLAFTTVKLGQTSFPELAGAIGRVAISASGLKITQEELNTVFATMTGVTGNAAEVSTQFRGAMTGLKKPSEDMKVALKGIGFETGEAALASLGFQGTLKSLMTQTGGNAAEMAKLFESTESWDLIQGIASVNADKFTSNLEAMEGAVGATDEAFKEQTEGVNAAGHAWNQLKSSFTVLLQQLGDELIPTFSKVVASIASSVKWFSALSPTVKKVIIVVAGLAAAIGPVLMVLGFMATGIAGLTAVMGPVLTVLGFMATALAAVSLPVVAVVAGIGLAVAALFAWRKEITAFIKKGINKFMESLDAWKVLLGKMTKAEAAAAKAQRELEADVEDFVPVIEEVTEVLEYQADALDEVTTASVELDDATTELNERIADQVTAWRQGGIPALKEAVAAYRLFGGAVHTLSTGQLQDLADTLEEGIETYQRSGEAVPHEATLAWMAALDELRIRAGGAAVAVGALNTEMVGLWFKPIHRVAVADALEGFGKLNAEVFKGKSVFEQWGDSVKGGFKDLWKGMTGGTSKISGLFSKLGSGIMDGFGQVISGGLSSLISMGVGLAMKGLAKLGGWIKGLFGVSAAEKEGRALVRTFEATVIASLDATQRAEAGGRKWAQIVIGVRDAYIKAGRSAEEAERMVAKLWAAEKRGPKAVQAILDSIQSVLDVASAIDKLTEDSIQGLTELAAEGARTGSLLPDQLQPFLDTLLELGEITEADMLALMTMAEQAQYDWRDVQAAAERYGVEVGLLGDRFRAAQLGEQAAQVAADWELMNVEGAKGNRIAQRMSETVQGLIDDYVAAGIAIPASLQPIIEKQVEMGLLTDANGDAISDVSQLDFAAPLVTQFDRLILAIQKLIDRLIGEDGVTSALEKVNNTPIQDRILTVDVHYDDQGYSPHYDDQGMGSYSHGTGGRFVDFGTGTPAVLHGKERVMTEAEGRQELAGLGALENRLVSIERLLRDQPRAFGVAMSDSLTLMN